MFKVWTIEDIKEVLNEAVSITGVGIDDIEIKISTKKMTRTFGWCGFKRIDGKIKTTNIKLSYWLVNGYYSEEVDFHKEITERNTEAQTTEDKLKSCPFCGGMTQLVDEQPTVGSIFYFVQCLKCFSRSGYYIDKQAAIDAWNKRS